MALLSDKDIYLQTQYDGDRMVRKAVIGRQLFSRNGGAIYIVEDILRHMLWDLDGFRISIIAKVLPEDFEEWSNYQGE